MYEGRGRAEWQRAAAIVATLINVNKTKGRPVNPDDINPFRSRRPKPKPIAVPFDVFLQSFVPVPPVKAKA